MKEYGDEAFIYRIALEREAPAPEPCDIRGGYAVIGEERLAFEEREAAPGRFSVIMPTDFKPMPLEAARIKYPNENRPSIIYSDERGETTLNFSLRAEELGEEDAGRARDVMRDTVLRLNPALKITSEDEFKTDHGVSAASFNFISPAIDGEVFNIMFVFPLDGRLVIGSFNCLGQEAGAWLEAAEQMVRSLKILSA